MSHMLTTITKPNGKIVELKNLRWLYENSENITSIQVLYPRNPDADCLLEATVHTDKGTVMFHSDMASYDVCVNHFLKRKKFAYIPIQIFHNKIEKKNYGIVGEVVHVKGSGYQLNFPEKPLTKSLVNAIMANHESNSLHASHRP